MLRSVPSGRYICNRRFQSAGSYLHYCFCHIVTTWIRKVLSRCDKGKHEFGNPPIEIGGYKYAVPMGRYISLRYISYYLRVT
jgi:hypothetical protein